MFRNDLNVECTRPNNLFADAVKKIVIVTNIFAYVGNMGSNVSIPYYCPQRIYIKLNNIYKNSHLCLYKRVVVSQFNHFLIY